MYFHNSLIPRGAYFLLPLESKREASSGWNFTKCISEVKVNQLKVWNMHVEMGISTFKYLQSVQHSAIRLWTTACQHIDCLPAKNQLFFCLAYKYNHWAFIDLKFKFLTSKRYWKQYQLILLALPLRKKVLCFLTTRKKQFLFGMCEGGMTKQNMDCLGVVFSNTHKCYFWRVVHCVLKSTKFHAFKNVWNMKYYTGAF